MTDVLSPTVFYIISGVLVLGVLVGLCLMSKPKTARAGNAISAVSAVAAIAAAMIVNRFFILLSPLFCLQM